MISKMLSLFFRDEVIKKAKELSNLYVYVALEDVKRGDIVQVDAEKGCLKKVESK